MWKLLLVLAVLVALAFVVFGVAAGGRSGGADMAGLQERIAGGLGRLIVDPLDPAEIDLSGPCARDERVITITGAATCRVAVPASDDRLRRAVLRVERGETGIRVEGTDYDGPRKTVEPGGRYELNFERPGGGIRLSCAASGGCRLSLEAPA